MTLGKPGEPQRQSHAITCSLLRGRLGRHTKRRQLEEEQGEISRCWTQGESDAAEAEKANLAPPPKLQEARKLLL